MTDITDILSLIVISALVAGALSYIFHDALRRMVHGLRHALLPPRYLKKSNELQRPKNRRS